MSGRFFVLKDLNKTKLRERSGMTTHLDKMIKFYDRSYYFYNEKDALWIREVDMDQNPDGFVWEYEYKEITENEAKEYMAAFAAKRFLLEE